VSFASVAIASVHALSIAPTTTVLEISSIATIALMLLFFARAALVETPYWSRHIQTAYVALGIPLLVLFLIVIFVRFLPVLTRR
jgi:hypothetical protein